MRIRSAFCERGRALGLERGNARHEHRLLRFNRREGLPHVVAGLVACLGRGAVDYFVRTLGDLGKAGGALHLQRRDRRGEPRPLLAAASDLRLERGDFRCAPFERRETVGPLDPEGGDLGREPLAALPLAGQRRLRGSERRGDLVPLRGDRSFRHPRRGQLVLEVADGRVARDQLEPLLLDQQIHLLELGLERRDPAAVLDDRRVPRRDRAARRARPLVGQLHLGRGRGKLRLERGNRRILLRDRRRERRDLALVPARRHGMRPGGLLHLGELQLEPPGRHGIGRAELVLLRLDLAQRHRQAALDPGPGKTMGATPHRRRERQRDQARRQKPEHEIHDRFDQRPGLHSRRSPAESSFRRRSAPVPD